MNWVQCKANRGKVAVGCSSNYTSSGYHHVGEKGRKHEYVSAPYGRYYSSWGVRQDDYNYKIKTPPAIDGIGEDIETPYSNFVELVGAGHPYVKVANIPRELKDADVLQVFKDHVGRVQCFHRRLDDASLIFGADTYDLAKSKSLAKQATDTYDLGFMNGKQIRVTYELECS